MTPQELLDLEKWLALFETKLAQSKEQPTSEQGPNPFDSLPPEVVVIARSSSGWSENPSSWEIKIRTNGALNQEWSAWTGVKRQIEMRRVNVGAEWVKMFLQRADELDFWNLIDNIDDVITDIGSQSLAIRNGTKWRAWQPEGVAYHANEGDEGARKFMELWNLVEAVAPRS